MKEALKSVQEKYNKLLKENEKLKEENAVLHQCIKAVEIKLKEAVDIVKEDE